MNHQVEFTKGFHAAVHPLPPVSPSVFVHLERVGAQHAFASVKAVGYRLVGRGSSPCNRS